MNSRSHILFRAFSARGVIGTRGSLGYFQNAIQSLRHSMANNLSKTQIDKLGDRLRGGNITEEDLRMLDEYRRSFSEAYEFVVGAIRSELALAPTGRP